MLDVAREREVRGDLIEQDMGDGLPFRSGTFDGAVSISAVQWLCNADTSTANPRHRIKRFFESLYRILNRGARAALQIYPENHAQAEMLVGSAMRVGFQGGLVVDFPHSTKAKKYFLVLMIGPSTVPQMPQAKGLDGMTEDYDDPDEEMDEDERGAVEVYGRKKGRMRKNSALQPKKNRAWIIKKKDSMRRKGRDVGALSNKYTGRKRKPKF